MKVSDFDVSSELVHPREFAGVLVDEARKKVGRPADIKEVGRLIEHTLRFAIRQMGFECGRTRNHLDALIAVMKTMPETKTAYLPDFEDAAVPGWEDVLLEVHRVLAFGAKPPEAQSNTRPKSTRFDLVGFQAMQEPLSVRVERIKGNTKQPITLPPNWTRDAVLQLEKWLLTTWGGGFYQASVVDAGGTEMTWQFIYDLRLFPEQVPPTPFGCGGCASEPDQPHDPRCPRRTS